MTHGAYVLAEREWIRRIGIISTSDGITLDIPTPSHHSSGMCRLPVILWIVFVTSPMIAASDWLRVLEKADAASDFAERLSTHREALNAILKADTTTLPNELIAWGEDDGWSRRNPFIHLAWTRLAKLDQKAALTALPEVHNQEAFEEAAREVWAAVAETNPALAYVAAQKFAPKDKIHHSTEWLVQHIMRAVGASWYRVTGEEALKRLRTLSHPDLMATAVFHGCMREARTIDDWLALLDRYTGAEKPVIEENHIKERHLCEKLVEAAARLDLERTRSWIERRFPPGTVRSGNKERDSHVEHARRALFFVWAQKEPLAAADWLAAQSPPAWDLYQCLRAVAGEDLERLPTALDWLAKQRGMQGRVEVIGQFLDFHFEDPVYREEMQALASWLAQRPVEEREQILLGAAQRHFLRFQDHDTFLTIVIPDEPRRRDFARRLEKTTGPPSGIEPYPWLLRVFDLPVTSEKPAVKIEDERRCHELARQHELSRSAVDPVLRRQGLLALEWMKQAPTVEIRAVLLARLRNHDMDWFSEGLLSAWVLNDWRGAEAFALQAPLSARKRDDMLVHIFCEAALKEPDAVLQRLNELQAAKTLNPAALGGPKATAELSWMTYYYGEMITRSLARGWCRQDDRRALASIQAIPRKWQWPAFEVLAEEFTTAEVGVAILSSFKPVEETERYLMQAPVVLRRLAGISPQHAIQWLEARPELLKDASDLDSMIQSFYWSWQHIDPVAARQWFVRAVGKNPPE